MIILIIETSPKLRYTLFQRYKSQLSQSTQRLIFCSLTLSPRSSVARLLVLQMHQALGLLRIPRSSFTYIVHLLHLWSICASTPCLVILLTSHTILLQSSTSLEPSNQPTWRCKVKLHELLEHYLNVSSFVVLLMFHATFSNSIRPSCCSVCCLGCAKSSSILTPLNH